MRTGEKDRQVLTTLVDSGFNGTDITEADNLTVAQPSSYCENNLLGHVC